MIRTQRLEMREFDLGDDEFALRLLNDPSFLQFIGDKGVRSLADARAYLAKGPIESYRRYGHGLYRVSLKADGPAIGMCGLVRREGLDDADVGFAFLPRYRARGYATEAAAAVLTHGRRQLGLARIVAIAAPENRASIAVLERIGLVFERTLRLGGDVRELNLYGPGSDAGGVQASIPRLLVSLQPNIAEQAMHPFPHHYVVTTAVSPDGDVPLSSEGVRVIESAPPKEFDGPGNQWSPEQLLTAAVADCFVLSFRAIAAASKFRWLSLDTRTRGTLDREAGVMRFTRFDTEAKLHVPAGTDIERAKRLLEKAESACLVANSLSSERHLSSEVIAS